MSVIDKVAVGGTTYDVQDARVAPLDERVNVLHGLVDYNYGEAIDSDTIAGSLADGTFRFVRTGTHIMINGAIKSNSSSTTARIRLNGTPTCTASNSTVDDWTDPLVLKDGHTYRLRAHTISGTATTRADTMFAVYNYGSHTPLGTRNMDGSDYVYDFTYNNGANGVQIALGWARNSNDGASFSNWVAEVTLEDITNLAVSGATPSITAEHDTRYVCTATYVESLSFTPSSTGICSVRFVSGTTPTVLTLPNTVKMPDWWTGPEASRTYEISIEDGVYGVVTSWT